MELEKSKGETPRGKGTKGQTRESPCRRFLKRQRWRGLQLRKWIPTHKQFHLNDSNCLEWSHEENAETQSRLSRGGGGVAGKGRDQLLMAPWAKEQGAEGHMTIALHESLLSSHLIEKMNEVYS